jgi:hypothetical protein
MREVFFVTDSRGLAMIASLAMIYHFQYDCGMNTSSAVDLTS